MSPSVELEFKLRGSPCAFVTASDAAACTIRGEEVFHRSDDTLLEYFTVTGAPQEAVLEAFRADSHVESVRPLRATSEGELYQVVVAGPCVAATLADTEAAIRSAVAVDGIATVLADVPGHAETSDVIDTFLERHPAAELSAKRTASGQLPGVAATDGPALLDSLTDKQRRALRTASASGYFDWPRESTAAECATALGISQPTFSQHLRRAEQKLVGSLFETTAGERITSVD